MPSGLGSAQSRVSRAQPIGQAEEAAALAFHLVAALEYCNYEILYMLKFGVGEVGLSLVINAFLPRIPLCQAGA